MLKNGKRVRVKRKFSPDFKKKIVHLYESGQHTTKEISSLYNISQYLIYRWIYRYSHYNKQSVQVVEFKDSQMNKVKELQKRIAELERIVGQKQMNIDFLNKMIELADAEYNIDIKKKSSTPHSGGSKNTKDK